MTRIVIFPPTNVDAYNAAHMTSLFCQERLGLNKAPTVLWELTEEAIECFTHTPPGLVVGEYYRLSAAARHKQLERAGLKGVPLLAVTDIPDTILRTSHEKIPDVCGLIGLDSLYNGQLALALQAFDKVRRSNGTLQDFSRHLANIREITTDENYMGYYLDNFDKLCHLERPNSSYPLLIPKQPPGWI